MSSRLVLVAVVCVGMASSVATAGARERQHAGGCGGTPLYVGSLPSWTAPATQQGSSTSSLWPHAMSRGRNVTAIVFGYPLQGGKPGSGRQNKVLWIMRLSRQSRPLRITARPLHANHPVVHETIPPDASPGQIYPSYVNVPSRGCWRLTLRWAGHTDHIALRYS